MVRNISPLLLVLLLTCMLACALLVLLLDAPAHAAPVRCTPTATPGATALRIVGGQIVAEEPPLVAVVILVFIGIMLAAALIARWLAGGNR